MSRTLPRRKDGTGGGGKQMTRIVIGRPLRAVVLLLPLLSACSPGANNFHLARDTVADGPFGGYTGPAMQDNPSASERRLAITHRLTIRVPSVEAEAIQQKHMAECAKLGCTILSTSIDRSNEGRINARASVRIKPDSYEAFAAVLAAPPAQITMRSQSAEDLAMPIVDAERRLAAKTALRERLTAMLHDQTVKTAGDLITIEKELAQVQTDIEAVTAQRDNLRTRTDMVRIEISYVGVAGQIAGADLSPIYQAVSQISQTVINSVAALISTLVAIVPWLPAIALIWWAAGRGVRRWKARRLA
jgi:hypothetical protein